MACAWPAKAAATPLSPTCRLLNADIDTDGAADNFDVDAFVECLVNRCP